MTVETPKEQLLLEAVTSTVQREAKDGMTKRLGISCFEYYPPPSIVRVSVEFQVLKTLEDGSEVRETLKIPKNFKL